jgi:hypothetical protein
MQDLEKIGVRALGHRRKLMAAVREPEEGRAGGSGLLLGPLLGGSRSAAGQQLPSHARSGVAMIDHDDLVLGEKLGSGSFGAVYRGILRGTTQVAVKQLKDVDNQAALLAEARLMGYTHTHTPHTAPRACVVRMRCVASCACR